MILWTLTSVALGADAITFDAVTSVALGEGSPSVTFHSRVTGGIDVKLRCGGKAFSMRQAITPGWSHTLALDGLAAGSTTCTGQLRLDEADGAWAERPLKFEVSMLSPLDWTFGAEDIDLEARTLVVHPSRALSRAEVELLGLGGAIVDSGAMDMSDPSNPTYAWSVTDEVLKVSVVGTDTSGTRSQLELSPWSYAIPHIDVVFESGSHTIQSAEEPKLEACWSDITAVIDKYGDVVDIELFVGGYTDTVGAHASNQQLSDRRARAIAEWFRGRGFERPVWYQGFGEDALAVSTPDETDALANRRALYLLSADTPSVSSALPRRAWRSL